MKKNLKKVVVIAVHDKTIHADEVFAVAILKMLLNILYKDDPKKIRIVRTRDKKLLAEADFRIDVGMEYDGSNNWDHHQFDTDKGEGVRENGIPFSSAGLLWHIYGPQVCGDADVAEIVEKKLIWSIDIQDHNKGIPSFPHYKKAQPFTVSSLIAMFNPVWNDGGADPDRDFEQAVLVAETILKRTIAYAEAVVAADSAVYMASLEADRKHKLYVVLKDNVPWREIIHRYVPKSMLYVICRVPGKKDERWVAYCIEDKGKHRKSFPAKWANREGEALAKVTGVVDALFCHAGLFTCSATTLEGAIALVELAIAAE
ncbi:MAG: MYG1 family protein [Patescibacteria group bacterium]|nr:MYG1 family protein [Patescibacteria group bacterium]